MKLLYCSLRKVRLRFDLLVVKKYLFDHFCSFDTGKQGVTQQQNISHKHFVNVFVQLAINFLTQQKD